MFYILYALKNTLIQAMISAFISCTLGITIAKIISTYHLHNIKQIIKMIGLIMFVIPSFIICIGVINIFDSIHGLYGIILCNIIINTFYCASIILQTYESIFTTNFLKQLSLLKLKTITKLVTIELPMIKNSILYSFFTICIMCTNNFGICMLMGDGPQSTTLPVIIYQYLIFDNNTKMLIISIAIQIMLSLIYFITLNQFKNKHSSNFSIDQPVNLNLIWPASVLAILLYYCATLYSAQIIIAIFNTIILGASTSLICALISLTSLTFLFTHQHFFYKFWYRATMIVLSVPDIIIVAFIYCVLHNLINNYYQCFTTLIISNIIIYLPFMLFFLAQTIYQLKQKYSNITALLRLNYWQILFTIIIPSYKNKLIFITSIVFCFTIGNITAQLIISIDKINTVTALAYKSALNYDFILANLYSFFLLIVMCFIIFLTNTKWIHEKNNHPKPAAFI